MAYLRRKKSEAPIVGSNDFSKVNVYTHTIVCRTNWKIHLSTLFEKLPLTPYELVPRKRGRKPRQQIDEEEKIIENGTIISIKYKNNVRGVNSKEHKKPFPNSLAIVIYFDKFLHVKISNNGKFDITGCLSFDHAYSCINYISTKASEIPFGSFLKMQGGVQKIIDIPPAIDYTDKPFLISNSSMINIRYNVGFTLDRDKFNSVLDSQEGFSSMIDDSYGYPGIVSRYAGMSKDKYMFTKFSLKEGKWTMETINYDAFVDHLSPKSRSKENKRERYTTFLTFKTGKVIQSCPYMHEMESMFDKFMHIVKRNKENIEMKFGVEDSDTDMIASGTYGDISVRENDIVVKTIPGKRGMNDIDGIDITFLRELDIYKTISSPYITNILNYEVGYPCCNLYLPKAICNLRQYGSKLRPSQRIKHSFQIFWSIFAAVYSLNKHGILHGDIKLDNFLVFGSKEGRKITMQEIRLCDFSTTKYNDDPYWESSIECYATPEDHRKRSDMTRKSNTTSDVYAAALCCCYFLLNEQIFSKISVVFDHVPKIILCCLNRIPEQRPSAEDVLKQLSSNDYSFDVLTSSVRQIVITQTKNVSSQMYRKNIINIILSAPGFDTVVSSDDVQSEEKIPLLVARTMQLTFRLYPNEVVLDRKVTEDIQTCLYLVQKYYYSFSGVASDYQKESSIYFRLGHLLMASPLPQFFQRRSAIEKMNYLLETGI